MDNGYDDEEGKEDHMSVTETLKSLLSTLRSGCNTHNYNYNQQHNPGNPRYSGKQHIVIIHLLLKLIMS